MILTDQQIDIVNHVSGHLVVVAGPGSGKTRTVVSKISHIFDKNIVPPPFSVLAITFSNAASNEMKSRLKQESFTDWDRIYIGTFHQFCRYLLTCYGSDVGVREDFEIADTSRQKEIISSIVPASGAKEVNSIIDAIDRQKQNGIYPGLGDEGLSVSFLAIYTKYQSELHANNLLDFNDLIFFAVELLKSSQIASRVFKRSYQYLFVDEFQDTDLKQLELIKVLAADALGSTIVADDDQSVYGWRGANPENIELIREYLDADIVQLGINFRSDQSIVDAANAVISKQMNRKEKLIQSNSAEKGAIFFDEHENEDAEAQFVTSCIRYKMEQDPALDLGQLAVIVRIRKRAEVIIDELSKQGIKWFDRSRLPFEDSWETLFALSILGQACEPTSSDRFYRLLSTVDLGGLAYKTNSVDALELASSMRNTICNNLLVDSSENEIMKVLNSVDYWKILNLGCWSDTDYKNRCANVVKMIEYLSEEEVRDKTRMLDLIDQLAGFGAVQILSGQECKGREFDYVFFPGLEEGVIPNFYAKSDHEISEERRIFYVVMTRARKELNLSYALNRMMPWGGIKRQVHSRFVGAIPDVLLSKR